MVKHWKAEQAANTAPVIEIPETVTNAMQKTAAVIWDATSSLAGETVERIQKKAGECIDKAKTELSEYAGEITRLEKELEQSQKNTTETEKRLSAATTQKPRSERASRMVITNWNARDLITRNYKLSLL